MATTPTQEAIPSEDPRNLKFNAGKFDEVMSSDAHYYTDRFGVQRWTIAGFEYTALEAIRAYGYITLDSFQAGATLTLPNQVLRDTSNGEYYRWDGIFPKNVPAGSTPASTGGESIGAWLSVGGAALRQELASDTGAAMIGIAQGGTVQSFIDDMAGIARQPLLQHKMIHDVDYNSLFTGAEALSQGFAICLTPAGTRMYFHQPVAATGNMRIVETTFNPDGSNESPAIISFSQELTDVGHQSIGAIFEDGNVVIYTPTKDGKGYNKIIWAGGATSDASVTRTNVFQPGFHETDVTVTMALSEDGSLLLLQTAGEELNQRGIDEDKRVIYLFTRSTGAFIRSITIPKANMIADAFQGLACDGRYLYILNGFTGVFLTQRIYIYDMNGSTRDPVRYFNIDGVRGKYGRAQMLGNAVLGYPVLQEPEGLAILNGKLYVMMPDFWNTTASVVSYEGGYFAARAASFSGQKPVNSSYWTPTTFGTAGAPAYNDATTYTISNPSKRTKAVVSVEVADGTGLPIDSGVANPDSFASIFLNNNSVNIALERGEALQICGFEQNLQSHRQIMMLSGESPDTSENAAVLWLYGRGFEDGAVTGRRVSLKHRENSVYDIFEFRSAEDLLHGAGINMHSNYSPTNPGRLQFYCSKPDNTVTYSLIFSPTTPSFHPQNDNEVSLGVADNRFSDVRSYKLTCIVPGTTQPQIRAANSLKNMIFQVSTTGNGGVFDDTLGRWLTYTNTSGFSRFYWNNTVFDQSGNGSPEGVLTASPGSEYRRLDGGIGTFKYQKQTGTGNTGWVAIA